MKKFLNNLLFVVPFFMALLLWLTIGLKCALLFYGGYSVGMFFHITVTTLSNALIGQDINVNGDLFWKGIFLILSCLCLSLFKFF
jgi:hypothetical protein